MKYFMHVKVLEKLIPGVQSLVRNSLYEKFWDLVHSSDSFRQFLKTVLFSLYYSDQNIIQFM